jgi:succinate dehydrogenase / fumarate reductase iron-sulfur subunit
VVRDLVVDRSSLDRLVSAGGFISAATGNAPDANAILIPKATVERAMDAASCIGCGACVAACPTASASLFIGAKIVHLGELPQGAPERDRRVLAMVDAATEAGFGHCANVGDCEVVCPKGIGIDVIGRMNRDFIRASLAALADR